MPKNKLFEDEEIEENVTSFKTENEYAKRYDRWREKEELHKLEQKYGDKPLGSDASVSSDSEDESDEPVEVSPEMEKQFLKTLSLLKTKDPRIYDPQYNFFKGDETKSQEVEKVEEKESKPKKQVDSLAAAFADSDDEDDGGEIFTVEKKAQPPPASEDKIKAFLTGQVEHVEEDVEQDLAPLKELWSDPQLNEGEAFLRDYILNKKYLEEGDVGDGHQKLLDDEGLEQDEKTVEEQGQFERAYNFRFEEPDEQYLKRYPRTMNYIRPKDDKRAKKRQEIRTRKEEEKKRKMDEIARLKALKLKEIQEKIAKIKEVTGNEELAFKETDIEGDFDPEDHDRRMRAIFDEQYYGDADDEKPVFPDLDEELEIENWDEYEEEQGNEETEDGPHCEDEDFNMDAAYDPVKSRQSLMEEISQTLGHKRRRNRKRKSKLAHLLAQEKPVYVPDGDKTYEQFMEEYYSMECEDVIAGEIPTRFKYRQTVPNDFGLTVEEILLADDKELNKWASLKKTVKYRPDHVEKGEVNTYRQKAADLQLKNKILPSLFKHLPEEPEIIVPPGRKAKKKNKNKNKQTNVEHNIDEEQNENDDRKQVDGNVNNDEIINTNTDNKETEEIDTNMLNGKKEVILKKKKNKRKKKHVNDNSIVDNDNKEVSNSIDSTLQSVNYVSIRSDNEENGSKIKENKNKLVNNLEANLNKSLDKSNAVEEVNLNNVTNKRKKKKNKNKVLNNLEVKVNESLDTSKAADEVKLSNVTNKKKKKKKNKNKDTTTNTDTPTTQKPNLKRKLDDQEANQTPSKKKKKNNKNKQKHNNKVVNNNKNSTNDNPLSKLSDGRLKAYGLNPKKYRSFLKYKKF